RGDRVARKAVPATVPVPASLGGTPPAQEAGAPRAAKTARPMSERELHEYVAEVEGHDSQVVGVVGYFYRMYRAEVLARVACVANRDILEIGCGEGMMFAGTGTTPVQMDVSMIRVARAAATSRLLLCADGYQ